MKNHTFEIKEVSGDRFQDLETVWGLARGELARNLVIKIRKLIESGELVILKGVIDLPREDDD